MSHRNTVGIIRAGYALKRLSVAAILGFSIAQPVQAGSEFIYVWAGDADERPGDKDFLATVVVDPASPDYGKIVATAPVPDVGTLPHHIEPTVASDNTFFASGYDANKIYLFDAADKTNPKLVKTISEIPGYELSHSFIREPATNRLIATMQYPNDAREKSGGLAIINSQGEVELTVNATAEGYDEPIRSYGVDIAPMIDRFIVTSTPMAMKESSTNAVQIYKTSTMELLHTLEIPVPESDPKRAKHPFEVRVLADDKSAIINTFQCGFYKVDGMDTDNPTIKLIYHLKKGGEVACAVPSIVGDYWIMPVQMANKVVVLDVSDADNVRQVFELKMQKNFCPHYSAVEEGTNRIMFSGFRGTNMRIIMGEVDPDTGAITIDENFRSEGSEYPGVDFARASWPHGDTGPAKPHGVVWSKQ